MGKGLVEVRVGDMHPNRSLKIRVQPDGDVIVIIQQDGLTIGGEDIGDPEKRVAQVEFCVSGGRSRHTLAAIRDHVIPAMEKDNVVWPISQYA